MAKWLSRKAVLIYISRELDEHILLYQWQTGKKQSGKDHLHSPIHLGGRTRSASDDLRGGIFNSVWKVKYVMYFN